MQTCLENEINKTSLIIELLVSRTWLNYGCGKNPMLSFDKAKDSFVWYFTGVYLSPKNKRTLLVANLLSFIWTMRSQETYCTTSSNLKSLSLKFRFPYTGFNGYINIFQKKKKQSEANLYSVPFGHYTLHETMPLSMMKRLDEEVPPVFMILDTFDKDVKSLRPGTHLFCVYGDNWYVKTIQLTSCCMLQ